MKMKEKKKKKRPGHCIIGHDYAEDKCKGVECRLKSLCRKLGSKGVIF